MFYVKRDASGTPVMVAREPGEDCHEALEANDPEILAFFEREGLMGQHRKLRDTDLAFVRVLEDVIELLIAKGVISFTELPEAAREKLLKRQTLRRQVNSVELLGDEDDEWLI
ncbi:tryptophan synthase subunit beta like protein [Halomonas coralii]|nr:tryptophan synthase subunit beta like protein [Modicisalibacter sp. R2A 31.J]MBZ9575143.1 tryptophan synthase subunit beta like protein [Modicisalibacter sp. MOD 31.J]